MLDVLMFMIPAVYTPWQWSLEKNQRNYQISKTMRK